MPVLVADCRQATQYASTRTSSSPGASKPTPQIRKNRLLPMPYPPCKQRTSSVRLQLDTVWCRLTPPRPQSPRHVLPIWLCYERHREDSLWGPWLRALPRHLDLVAEWSAAEREALRPSWLAEAAANDDEDLRGSCETPPHPPRPIPASLATWG